MILFLFLLIWAGMLLPYKPCKYHLYFIVLELVTLKDLKLCTNIKLMLLDATELHDEVHIVFT